MKKKIGRPTKYDSKYCEAIVKFFEREPYYEKELEHVDKDGNYKWSDYKRLPNDLPTFAHFAKKIGVNGDTLVEWVKKHEEFSAAYTRAKELQKEFLIENGLQGLYNPTFAIFTAKNITDMRDVQSTELTGLNGQPLQFSFKIDLAGGYIPPMGAIITAPGASITGSSPIQSVGLAQTGKKNNNSPNGVN